jgi:signal transduction histidine kinase
MSETIRSTRDPRRITRIGQPFGWRVAAFVVAVFIGALAIAWIDASTWTRVQELERDFGTVKTERFYHAIHMRTALWQLNDTLLRFQVKGEPSDLQRFRADAQELKQWIAARKREVARGDERTLFDQLAGAYETYLRDSSSLEERPGLVFAKQRFDEAAEKLRQNSALLLDLCERLMQTQRQGFGSFLGESQGTLDSLQRLIKLSLVLMVVLGASVVVLVYRGMIAPLQMQLSESRAAMERQEKLAALGGLAAGVAHEIRNPLTAIKFRLFSLRKSLPVSESEREDLTVIATEINRLERIVKDFLQFARPSEPEIVNAPAARILDEVRELLRAHLAKAAIELKLETKDDVWLRADTQQIKQVLINLIQNAAESIGRGGTITLRVVSDNAPLAGSSQPVAIVEVADTGKGIPPEVQKRLFDPFFTTKEGGTGLGLPIAARIVEKHGGDLRYQTQVNRGTTFRVVLPRAADHEI